MSLKSYRGPCSFTRLEVSWPLATLSGTALAVRCAGGRAQSTGGCVQSAGGLYTAIEKSRGLLPPLSGTAPAVRCTGGRAQSAGGRCNLSFLSVSCCCSCMSHSASLNSGYATPGTTPGTAPARPLDWRHVSAMPDAACSAAWWLLGWEERLADQRLLKWDQIFYSQ